MIEKLEYLLALAQERHFGRAAGACNVAQATLSAGIKHLEDSLGALLVERGSRFRGFTEAGERTLDWARRIVGDARAMRQDIGASRAALSGHLRIAAIPTAIPMTPSLTGSLFHRHPKIQFTVLSRTSEEVLGMLENLEIDAGLTYLDSEPLGRVATVPIYRERFHFVTSEDGPFAGRQSVAWAELGRSPLCLLTPDMQNRRIIDRALRAAGAEARPVLDSDSLMALVAHVRTGHWSSVLPEHMHAAVGFPATIRCVPIVEPEVASLIGLVVPLREPMTPLTAALVAEAKRLAITIEHGLPGEGAEAE